MFYKYIYTKTWFLFDVVLNGICCVFGIAGNLISLVVLYRMKEQKSTVYLLFSLGVVDALFLVNTMISRVIPGACLVAEYSECHSAIFAGLWISWSLGSMVHTAGTWLIVAITCERYLAVCYPFRAIAWNMPKKIKRVIVGILLAAVLFNIPRFFDKRGIGLKMTNKVKGERLREKYEDETTNEVTLLYTEYEITTFPNANATTTTHLSTNTERMTHRKGNLETTSQTTTTEGMPLKTTSKDFYSWFFSGHESSWKQHNDLPTHYLRNPNVLVRFTRDVSHMHVLTPFDCFTMGSIYDEVYCCSTYPDQCDNELKKKGKMKQEYDKYGNKDKEQEHSMMKKKGRLLPSPPPHHPKVTYTINVEGQNQGVSLQMDNDESTTSIHPGSSNHPYPNRITNKGRHTVMHYVYNITLTWLLVYLIPLLLLFTLNILLIRELRKAQAKHAEMTHQEEDQNNRALTLNTIVLVVVFLICQTPDFVLVILHGNFKDIGLDLKILWTINYVKIFLLSLNTSINFLIYCVFYRGFREVLCDMLCTSRCLRKE